MIPSRGDQRAYRQMNISAGRGIAVREFPLSTGEADYLLYADAKARNQSPPDSTAGFFKSG